MNKYSERRLVENELLFRAANQKVQRRIQKDSSQAEGPDATTVHFYCECSNIDCRDRIPLTADEYEQATAGKKDFVVLPGHQNAGIEKVIAENEKYTLVEKFVDPSKVLSDLV